VAFRITRILWIASNMIRLARTVSIVGVALITACGAASFVPPTAAESEPCGHRNVCERGLKCCNCPGGAQHDGTCEKECSTCDTIHPVP
jgi:predicted transglutaminase-like cysteine proteinase